MHPFRFVALDCRQTFRELRIPSLIYKYLCRLTSSLSYNTFIQIFSLAVRLSNPQYFPPYLIESHKSISPANSSLNSCLKNILTFSSTFCPDYFYNLRPHQFLRNVQSITKPATNNITPIKLLPVSPNI